MNLPVSLKILAVFFWWYGVVFVLSVARLQGVDISIVPFLDFRGETYAWDFEFMFTLIFLVWGSYLWRASREPEKHKLFIDFTITATTAHILAMLVIALIRSEDFWHLIGDALALSVPTALVLVARFRLPKRE